MVSIVIITRNRPKVLEQCLNKIYQQKRDNIFEIIIVDSSDNHDTKEIVKNQKSPIKKYIQIFDGRNNMPQARNAGLTYANGEITAFLDDDSMATKEWLKEIAKGYSENYVGAVGGRIIDRTDKKKASVPYIGKFDKSKLFFYSNFFLTPDSNINVDWLRGCNMSFKTRLLKDLGGFDENYIGDNSMEEMDICARVQDAGYRIIFNPRAVVNHLACKREDYLRDYQDPRISFYRSRNRTYYLLKRFGLKTSFLRIFIKEPFWWFNIKKLRNLNDLRHYMLLLIGKLAGLCSYMVKYLLNNKSKRINLI